MGFFDKLFQWIKDMWNALIEGIFKPVWLLIQSWWVAIVTIITAVILILTKVFEFLAQMLIKMAEAFGVLSATHQDGANWTGASSILGTMNVFFPVVELFAMLTLTMLIVSSIVIVKMGFWFRKLIFP